MNDQPTDAPDTPRWTVITRVERRVLGVLVEKAKTTPAAYPLSLNAVRTGSNQKSNRFPQMELEEHHAEEALDQLRQRGAVSIIQGDARVEKYRHLAYDWLGVDKTELAVMAELLLRGAQTLGELRGRAARMEPIKGMSELTPIVAGLVEKGLVVYLTPPGRGAVVTHTLYEPKEMEKVQREHGGGTAPVAASPSAPSAVALSPGTPLSDAASSGTALSTSVPQAATVSAPAAADWRAELAALQTEFQDQIAELQSEIEDLRQRISG